MAAPLGTASLPLYVRIDGIEQTVGSIELDVTADFAPQIQAVTRSIEHALAPCQGEAVAEPGFASVLGDGGEEYRDALSTAAAVAWTDYRNAYGVTNGQMVIAHKAFLAGWDAAYGADHAGALR
jgi:hypothetical protein